MVPGAIISKLFGAGSPADQGRSYKTKTSSMATYAFCLISCMARSSALGGSSASGAASCFICCSWPGDGAQGCLAVNSAQNFAASSSSWESAVVSAAAGPSGAAPHPSGAASCAAFAACAASAFAAAAASVFLRSSSLKVAMALSIRPMICAKSQVGSVSTKSNFSILSHARERPREKTLLKPVSPDTINRLKSLSPLATPDQTPANLFCKCDLYLAASNAVLQSSLKTNKVMLLFFNLGTSPPERISASPMICMTCLATTSCNENADFSSETVLPSSAVHSSQEMKYVCAKALACRKWTPLRHTARDAKTLGSHACSNVFASLRRWTLLPCRYVPNNSSTPRPSVASAADAAGDLQNVKYFIAVSKTCGITCTEACTDDVSTCNCHCKKLSHSTHST